MISQRPDIRNLLEERILIIDGSMGALIMSNNPTEEGYRGERFKNHNVDIRNATDLLVLTQPKLISGIHQQYLDAGADIKDCGNIRICGRSYCFFPYALHRLPLPLNIPACNHGSKAVTLGWQVSKSVINPAPQSPAPHNCHATRNSAPIAPAAVPTPAAGDYGWWSLRCG